MPLSMKIRLLILVNLSVLSQAKNSSDSPQGTIVVDRLQKGARRDDDGWVQVACIEDTNTDGNQVFDQNSKELCLEHCKNGGYVFAWIKRRQCKCGKTPSNFIKNDNGCPKSWWEVFASKGKYIVRNLNQQIVFMQSTSTGISERSNDSSEMDGEIICEKPGFDQDQCLAVGCCHWNDKVLSLPFSL